MKLEEQVVSLPLAQRLKELGVPQESVFYWATTIWQKEYELYAAEYFSEIDTTRMTTYEDSRTEGDSWDVKECYSAFTVAELGEMLPLYLKEDADRGIAFSVETDSLRIHKTYDGKSWAVAYRWRYAIADKEADARAKMLISLREQLDLTRKEDG